MSPTMKWFLRLGPVMVLLVVVVFYLSLGANDRVAQPIAYNHKIHIESAGLTCTDCHSSVQSSSAASIPNLEMCSTCHSEQPISESAEELKLIEFVHQGTSIPWQRVYHVPDHVFFSHRRHVVIARLECTTCHGNVDEFTEPVAAQFLPITMDNCMECHRENNVTNDCLSCHR